MAAEIRIPPLGESINEATLVRWLKVDGAHVEADEVVLELETEKAAMEVQAETAGRLKIVVPAGSQVTPGTVVGRITEEAAPARKDAATETRQAPADKPRVAEPVGAAHHRHHEPARGADGDAEMDVARLHNVGAIDPRIEDGNLAECVDHRAREERHETEVDAVPGLETLAVPRAQRL